MFWSGMMRVLVSNHNPPPVKFGLSQGLLGKLYRVVKRRYIDLYIHCKNIIKEPYTVISKEDKTKPAMYFNSRFNREDIYYVPDIGSGKNQNDKTQSIYPMPDSDW
jgi:hypothetical protein